MISIFALFAGASCPSGFTAINGDCYMLTSTRTWSSSQSTCEASGAKLVTITSQTQNNALLNYYSSRATYALWIGYKRVVTRGAFAWQDGSTSTYTNWDAGEPNNFGGIPEDFGGMYVSNGLWHDFPVSSSQQGICKLPCPTGISFSDSLHLLE